MTAPYLDTVQAECPAVTIAATTTTPVGVSPVAGVVSAVTYTPIAAITGAATNNRTLSLVNKGQAGVGTTVVATLNFALGVNGVADEPVVLPLSAVAGATAVAQGDVLAFVSAAVGTGIVDPGGLVEVTFSRVSAQD